MVSFVNIEVNNLRKTPVLQLKQSNSPFTLYTCFTSKSCMKSSGWGTHAKESIIKSGQKDTEASKYTCFAMAQPDVGRWPFYPTVTVSQASDLPFRVSPCHKEFFLFKILGLICALLSVSHCLMAFLLSPFLFTVTVSLKIFL